jgi:hypothetical protein
MAMVIVTITREASLEIMAASLLCDCKDCKEDR